MSKLNPVCRFLILSFIFCLSACAPAGPHYGGPGQAVPPQAQRPPGTILEAPATPPATVAQPAPAAAELPRVKVALLLPLSGQQAALGQAMLQAAQMAVFDIGHTNFELLPRDTGATPETARAAVQSALEGGAQLILGPVFADTVRAVAPGARSAGVNVIAFSTDWTLAGGNVFLMGFTPFDQVDRIAAYAAGHNLRRIGVFAPDSEYGQAVTGAYRSAAARHRLQTAAIVNFPQGTSAQQAAADFAGRATAADAVLLPMGGEPARAVSSALSAAGLPAASVRRLGTGLLEDPGYRATGADSMDGAWFAAPAPELRKSFESRYLQTYGAPAPRLSTLAYDATALAAVLAQRGLRSGGKPAFDRGSIANPNGFAGVDGIFRFRANGTAERGLAVMELRGGRPVTIDPAPQTFQSAAF